MTDHNELPSSPAGEGLPAIDRDELMDRDYIPFPGGWELQTKGKGSSLRLCDTKSGKRFVLAVPQFVIDFIERFGREVHAAIASQAPRREPSHDASERTDIAKRLRGIAEAVGCKARVPDGNDEAYAAIFTCLGAIQSALYRANIALWNSVELSIASLADPKQGIPDWLRNATPSTGLTPQRESEDTRDTERLDWRFMSLAAKFRDLLHYLQHANIQCPSNGDADEAEKTLHSIRDFLDEHCGGTIGTDSQEASNGEV